MITEPSQRRNRLGEVVAEMRQWMLERLAAPPAPVPLTRPHLAQLARPDAELPACVAACPVARRYLDLLGSLDWDHFPERYRHRPWPGSTPAPRAPFVAAYLVKLDQDKRYMSDLRSYLVDHPALVWVLGFPLVASAVQPWGFDVKASVPSRKQLGRVLRKTVPASGEKPLLPRPVYRAYDVGVLFKTNYVESMYRLAWRDLGLYLYDNNSRPVRDAQGRLIVLNNCWGQQEEADPHRE